LITMILAPRLQASSCLRNLRLSVPDQFQGDAGSLRIQQRLHAISPKSLYSFSDTCGNRYTGEGYRSQRIEKMPLLLLPNCQRTMPQMLAVKR